MQSIKIKFNRLKIILILIITTGCAYLCYHLMTHSDEWLSYKYRSTALIAITGFTGFVFCCMGSLAMLTILVQRKTAIIIDEKGITEYSSICSVGLIEWKDIKYISVKKMGSNNNFLSIYVKNNRKYLALSKNPLQVLMMKGNIMFYDTPFFISFSFLKCNFTELSKIVQEAHEKYKADKQI